MARRRLRSRPKAARPLPRAADTKDMLLLGASVAAGVFDFFAEVESGTAPLVAAKKAIKRTKARGQAIVQAELASEEDDDEA